jgi:opacity protein-like surface antigen
MKRHSRSEGARGYYRRLLLVALAAASIANPLPAQRHPWSVTGTAGVAALQLDAVDKDNAADAEGWARAGFPVSAFPSLRTAPLYTLRVGYRQDRDLAFSLRAHYSSKTVTASLRSSDGDLDLTRGVRSVDLALGISYYPPLRLSFLEWYCEAAVGVTATTARATAVGTQYVKVGNTPTPAPLVDTDAKFSASKASVGAGLGIDLPLTSRLALRAEAFYRIAQFGRLDGMVRRFNEQADATTTAEFNYSGFLLSAGLRYDL